MNSAHLEQGLHITRLLLEAVDDPERLRVALHAMTLLADADAGLLASARRGENAVHGFVVTTARDDWSGGREQVAFPDLALYRRLEAHAAPERLHELRSLAGEHGSTPALAEDTECLLAHLEADGGMVTYVGFVRRAPDGSRIEATRRALLEGLLPHLGRTLAITRRLEPVRAIGVAAMHRFDRYAIGVAIVDEHGVLQYCNEAARALFTAADALYIDGEGRIGAQDEDSGTALLHAIRTHISSDLSDVDVARELLHIGRGAGREPLAVAISPYRSSAGTSLHGPLAGLAVVFIHNAEQPLARVTDVIGKVYGLSDQEAELVEAIAAGDSPEEIAHAAGRSIIAVRSQLKRVFRKTGTTKQAELMKLVLSGPIAMVR